METFLLPSEHLPVQNLNSNFRKRWKNVCLISFARLKPFSKVTIVDFEQVNVCWGGSFYMVTIVNKINYILNLYSGLKHE